MKTYKSNSRIAVAINIKDDEELDKLVANLSATSQVVARLVLIHKFSYLVAGSKYGMSKQAVYELMKRLYRKKYGEEYGKRNSNTKNP